MNTQTLIITEKPSVARAIAAALGANVRGDGCIHGNNLIVSWCYGHLVELAVPAAYDEKLSKWRREDLPILPEPWKISVMRDKWTQFEILRGLMQRTDVGEVVNACDAGREGELIFRLVYEKAGCTKSVKRLWLSSMEPDEIRKAYANMRPGAEYDNLYAAALCRAKADWLVGMNATRLMSLVYHRTLNVGRVVSPTLSLLVERKREIEEFKPETFYTVALDCGGVLLSSERLADKAEADTLADMCHEAHIVKVERREKRENPPALYDLTALQREANRELGFTAQQTLDYLQALYEKRLVTYPRTDSRYLTDGMAATVPELVSVAAKLLDVDAPASVNAEQVCDSSKVTDHHAVVPTPSAATSILPHSPRARRRCCGSSAASCFARCPRRSSTPKPRSKQSAADTRSKPAARPSSTSAGARTRARLSGRRCPSLPKATAISHHDRERQGGQNHAARRFHRGHAAFAAMERAGAKEAPADVRTSRPRHPRHARGDD